MQMEYYLKKPYATVLSFNEYGLEEVYDPTQLKYINVIFKRNYTYLMKYYNNLEE